MERKSIWSLELKKTCNKLNEDINVDVLIIGGGIAGMTTAYNLRDSNKKVALIEKGVIGSGMTSRTTAKLNYMQGDLLDKIHSNYGTDVLNKYIESQKYAIDKVKEIIKENDIDCDFKENKSYIFSIDKDIKVKDYLKTDYMLSDKLPIDFPCNKAICGFNTGVFHPIKYLNGLRKAIGDKVSIYENTRAIDLDASDNFYYIKTDSGNIKTKNVVICTHYPFFIIPGFMIIKLYLEKFYALMAKDKEKDFNAINIDKDIYSIRYYKDNLIFGGFSHNLSDYLDDEDRFVKFYKNHFNREIDYLWQAHDVMTHDGLPLIGSLNKRHPNLFIATGFNKWGMTNGTLAGFIISDLIEGKNNKYASLFRTNRNLSLPKTLSFFQNNFKIGKEFVKSKLSNPYAVKINGVKCMVYTDDEGRRHIVKNTCPHFKCGLMFNEKEKTWDCPCHGSRFDIDGKLICGPSVFDIN